MSALRSETPGKSTDTEGKIQMPTRPGFGTKGQKILLFANYFEMLPNPDATLYRYSVDITERAGKVPVGRKLNRVIELLIDGPLQAYRTHIATDGKANIVSAVTLDQDKLLENTHEVVYRADDEDVATPGATAYIIKIQSTGAFPMSALLNL